MPTIAQLAQLGIEVDTTEVRQANQDLNRLERESRNVERQTGRTSTATAALGKVFRVAGATIAGIGFATLIKNQLDTADKMAKLSLRLGEQTESFSELAFAAEQTGVQFNTLALAFQRQQRRIAEAAKGTGEAKNALLELGLSADKLNQIPVSQQFEVLADAFAGVTNQADKTRLAMKIFDSEGVALIQTMQGGSAAIQGLRKEAHELGRTLTTEQAVAAEQANDSMNRLNSILRSTTQELAVQLAPIIRDVSGYIKDNMIPIISKLGGAFYGVQVVVRILQTYFTNYFTVIGNIVSGFKVIISTLGDFKDNGLEAFTGFTERLKASQVETVSLSQALQDLKKEREEQKELDKKDAADREKALRQSQEEAARRLKLGGFTLNQEEKDKLLKDTDESAKAADKLRASRESLVESLIIEADAERRITDARRLGEDVAQEVIEQIAIENELRSVGLTLKDEEGRKIAEIIRAKNDEIQARENIIEAEQKEAEAAKRLAREQRDALNNSKDFRDGITRGFISIQNEISDFASVSENLVTGSFRRIEDTIIAAATGAKVQISDLVNFIIAELTRLSLRKTVIPFFTDIGSSLLSGFQTGGQFQVEGSGGPDSQVVAFRATPGETVTVTPPGGNLPTLSGGSRSTQGIIPTSFKTSPNTTNNFNFNVELNASIASNIDIETVGRDLAEAASKFYQEKTQEFKSRNF